MTIYDANGNPKEVESVDAREHIATGHWFDAPPANPEPKPVKPEPVKPKKGDSK